MMSKIKINHALVPHQMESYNSMGKGKQFWRLNVLSWEANQFLTKLYVSTISLKSWWKCSAHPLKNVTMLFGLPLAPKFFLMREMTVT